MITNFKNLQTPKVKLWTYLIPDLSTRTKFETCRKSQNFENMAKPGNTIIQGLAVSLFVILFCVCILPCVLLSNAVFFIRRDYPLTVDFKGFSAQSNKRQWISSGLYIQKYLGMHMTIKGETVIQYT